MKRKTMKNLTLLCFLSGTMLLARATYVMVSHHHQSAQRTRFPASVEQTDGAAPAGTAALSTKGRPGTQKLAQNRQALQAKLKDFFLKVHNEFGNDETGNLAMVLFIRQVAPKTVAQDRRLKDLCTSQKTCPMNLAELYKVGLNRLDGDSDAIAKEIFQEQMIHSELPKETKIAFLTQTMLTSKIQKLNSPSKMIDKNRVLFGTDAKYMLSTSRQLLKVNIPAPDYLTTMLDALARSHDAVAQKVVTKALLKAYPKYAKTINDGAKKMKITLASN